MGKEEERVRDDIRYYEELLRLTKKVGIQTVDELSKYPRHREWHEKHPRYLHNFEKNLVAVIIALKKLHKDTFNLPK